MDQKPTSPTARKAHVILDHNQWFFLRERFEEGHSVAWLSREFNVSRGTIDSRRKRERWLRKTPGALASPDLPVSLTEPVGSLHDAARVTCARVLVAFNADDREAVRDLARLAELLSRLSCKFEPNLANAEADPAREFTPARDVFDLFAAHLGLPTQEDGE